MERLYHQLKTLLQHVKRVAYQAGIWCTSEQSEQHAPKPDGWGCTLDEESQQGRSQRGVQLNPLQINDIHDYCICL